jgi:hypothetical protein
MNAHFGVTEDFFPRAMVYLTLLGVYLIILGIAVAGLLSVLRNRGREERRQDR